MPMMTFMQTVGIAVMPSMKQRLAKSYFYPANHTVSSKNLSFLPAIFHFILSAQAANMLKLYY